MTVATDLVFLGLPAKFGGIRKLLEQRSQAGSSTTVLVAHFKSTLVELQKISQPSEDQTIAVLAKDLTPSIAMGMTLEDNARIDLIVAERHVLQFGDERLIAFAESLPCKTRIVYVLSLEDAALVQFAGVGLQDLMRQTGQEEDEAVVHRFVASRIRAAQRVMTNRLEREYYPRVRADKHFHLEWFQQWIEGMSSEPAETIYSSTFMLHYKVRNAIRNADKLMLPRVRGQLSSMSKIDVYDAYAKNSKKNIIRFLVLVPNGTTAEAAHQFACKWLLDMGLRDATLPQSNCNLSYSKKASQSEMRYVEAYGFHIVPKQGCP